MNFLQTLLQKEYILLPILDKYQGFLIDPIAITCLINFDARKFTKFMAKYEPVFN